MCGIAGVYYFNPDDTYSEKQTEKLVDALFIGIEPRGDHATGIAAMDKHGITSIEKADTNATTFINWRRDVMPEAQTILLHTRWATQGSPMNLDNNHPIHYENVYAIHNGHIRNDDLLFKQEELPRNAEVDSEIIAAMFNKYGLEKATIPLEKLSGNFAIGVFDRREVGKLLLAKGIGSPLMWIRTEKALIWASTEKAIKEAVKYAIDLDVDWKHMNDAQNGDIVMLDNGELELGRFNTWTVSSWNSKGYTSTRATPKDDSNLGKSFDWEKWREEQIKKSDKEAKQWEIWDEEMDICDGCYKTFAGWKLTNIWGEMYCDQCKDAVRTGNATPNMNSCSAPATKESQKEEKEEKEEEYTLEQELDDEHWAICELVAEMHNSTPDFVDYLLFANDDLTSEDQNVVNIYMAFSEAYDKLYSDLVRGFRPNKKEEFVSL